MDAVFFEEESALAVVARLVGSGWTARAERGRFAGEDDDEDQPWVVHSDAPDFVLELLTDEHDGWLDVPAPQASAPLELPQAPRRHHRPPLEGAGD